MHPTPNERKIAASIAAHHGWAQTTNRTERTAPGRRALDQRFLNEAGGDPVKAENLRKAHFKTLALKSVQARRRAREAAETARTAEAELSELGESPPPLEPTDVLGNDKGHAV